MGLDFGSFARTLQGYVKGNRSFDTEPEYVQALLASPFYPEDPEGYIGKTKGSRKSKATQYLTGTYVFATKIIKAFEEASLEDIREFMFSEILPFLDPGRARELIEKMRALVFGDNQIDREYRQKIKDAFREVDRIDDLEKMNRTEKNAYAELLAILLTWTVLRRSKKYEKRINSYPLIFSYPASTTYFTGREEELDMIADNFIAGSHVQVIYGIGGIGKTQVAAQYVYLNRIGYEYVHWADASSEESSIESYRRFLDKVIPQLPDSHEKIIYEFQRFFDEHSNWLIIYDDCNPSSDQLNTLLGILPRNQTGGEILITSRRRLPIDGAAYVPVEVLTEEDACDFLSRRVGFSEVEIEKNDNKEAIKRLALRLGRYALALELAGAYLHETPGVTPDSYIEELNQNITLLEDNKETDVLGYDQTILGIIQKTKTQIKAKFPEETAKGELDILLLLCSSLAPRDIDLGLFRYCEKAGHDGSVFAGRKFELFWFLEDKGFEERMTKKFRPFEETTANLMTLRKYGSWLVRYGLATRKGTMLEMHPLIQEVIRRQVSPGLQAACSFGLLELLGCAFDDQKTLKENASLENQDYTEQEGFAIRVHIAQIVKNLVPCIEEYRKGKRPNDESRKFIDGLVEALSAQLDYYHATLEIGMSISRINHLSSGKKKLSLVTEEEIKSCFRTLREILESGKLEYNERNIFSASLASVGFSLSLHEHVKLLYKLIKLAVQHREFELFEYLFFRLVCDVGDSFDWIRQIFSGYETYLMETGETDESMKIPFKVAGDYADILFEEVYGSLAMYTCYGRLEDEAVIEKVDKIYACLNELYCSAIKNLQFGHDYMLRIFEKCEKNLNNYPLLKKSYLEHDPSLLPERYKNYMKEVFNYSAG